MASMGYNGVKGMEQLVYNTQRLSFGDVPEAHLCRRDRLGADEIVHKLANTQLSDSSSSNNSGDTKTARKKYFRAESLCLNRKELNPAYWRELACAALEEYRSTQGVTLEFTSLMKAIPFYLPFLCCFHLNFKANDTTGTTKKMFAEVLQYDSGACKVNFCDILGPVNCDVMKGCDVCPRYVLHPKGVKFHYQSETLGQEYGAINEVAARFSVSSRTVARIWKDAEKQRSQDKIVNVNSKKTASKMASRKVLDDDKLKSIELMKRTTQSDVAEGMGVSQSTISRWVTSKKIKSHTNALKPDQVRSKNNKQSSESD